MLAEALRAQALRAPAPAVQPEQRGEPPVTDLPTADLPADLEESETAAERPPEKPAGESQQVDASRPSPDLLLAGGDFELLSGTEYGNTDYLTGPAGPASADTDRYTAGSRSIGTVAFDRISDGLTGMAGGCGPTVRRDVSAGWLLLVVALLGLAAGAIAGLLSVL